MSKVEDFYRDDIDTYKPKYKLYCKEVEFKIIRYDGNNNDNIL